MIAPGADVKEGQPVMELETDKAVIEVPSSVSGKVNEIRVKEGDKLKVGQVIFTGENGAGGSKAASVETQTPTVSAPREDSDYGAAGVPGRPGIEAQSSQEPAPTPPPVERHEATSPSARA